MKRKWIGLVLLAVSPCLAAQQWASPDASQSDKCAMLGLTAYTVVHDRAQGMTPDEVLNDIWSQCNQSPHASSESCAKFAQKLRREVIAMYKSDILFIKSFHYTADPNSPVNVEKRARYLQTFAVGHCAEILQ